MAIETNADVARRVRGVVAEQKVKRATIATELRISRMALWRRMEGETPFEPAELIKVARLAGVTVAAFYTESDLAEFEVQQAVAS